jgi:hypothetical protein
MDGGQKALKTAFPALNAAPQQPTGTKTMSHSLLDMIDRFAMTFGNLALLAALPVAAIALVAHAL